MIAMEDRRREEIEKDIAAMEIEERQHIERLRELQEEQKGAYDELEQALASEGGARRSRRLSAGRGIAGRTPRCAEIGCSGEAPRSASHRPRRGAGG